MRYKYGVKVQLLHHNHGGTTICTGAQSRLHNSVSFVRKRCVLYTLAETGCFFELLVSQ